MSFAHLIFHNCQVLKMENSSDTEVVVQQNLKLEEIVDLDA